MANDKTRAVLGPMQRVLAALAIGSATFIVSIASAQSSSASNCGIAVTATDHSTVNVNVEHCYTQARGELKNVIKQGDEIADEVSQMRAEIQTLQRALLQLLDELQTKKQQNASVEELEHGQSEIARLAGELQAKQTSLEMKEQEVQEARGREADLRTQLDELRKLDKLQRVTPDPHEIVGFALLGTGTAVAIVAGVVTANKNSTLNHELQLNFPTLSEAEAHSLAHSIKTWNYVTDGAVVVGCIGAALGFSYLVGLFKSELPGVDRVDASVNRNQISLQVRGTWGSAL